MTDSHLADLYELVSAESTAVLGMCPHTVEDVRSWITPPEGGLSAQLLVRDRDHGAPAQWWGAFRDPGGQIVYAFVLTHPRVTDAVGDRLAAAGWAALLDWIRRELVDEGVETTVQSGMAHGNDAARRRLHAAGFAHARTLWAMSGAVADDPRADEGLGAGHTIAATQDAVTMHRILDAAFADHWGYESLGFDDWMAVERSFAGHDPSLWRFAELDGVPVSAMIMSRRGADEGFLYVQEPATLRRTAGEASHSLLRHAFDVAALCPAGFSKVDLHVDSSNAYDAPAIYRRAGLDVRYAWEAFTQTLVS